MNLFAFEDVGIHRLCSFDSLLYLLLEHVLVHIFLPGFCVWHSSWAVEDLGNFFQTAAFGLREAEIRDRKEDG